MKPLAALLAAFFVGAWLPSGTVRTSDGRPDLQGVWDFRSATPLERPARFAGKATLTDEEVRAYEQLALERAEVDGRPPDDARSAEDQSVHPVWWLDYGKKVVKTHQTSLVVDPPDGRIPPLTEDGRKRAAARREAARRHGPADDPENRPLQERCITWGVPQSLLPGAYNNNLQIVQTPNSVVLFTEMIHNARVVPMDGSPHPPAAVRNWGGDPRGHWEGDTLVVDSTNFSDKSNFRGASVNLHLIERFTLIDQNTLEYRVTLDDPTTWTRPWTIAYPMTRTSDKIYEYACHEANYGMRNTLAAARLGDKE
ncbi:MAG TPA: hypothetical protein VFA59_18540 [Vicinamibacterales bacterium]|nr:hypothetical protein [Vicinamibacterales bacterium]